MCSLLDISCKKVFETVEVFMMRVMLYWFVKNAYAYNFASRFRAGFSNSSLTRAVSRVKLRADPLRIYCELRP